MEQEVAAPIEEYKNDNLTVKVIRKPQCVVEFHVHASPKLAKDAYEKALRAISKQVSLPGFRKGKAPQEVVQKKFTKDIDREWQQEIANVAFPETEKLANVPVLKKESKINYNIKNYTIDQGADLIFTFETEPTIPQVDPSTFTLKAVDRPAVTDVQIDETIRQIGFFFAEWKHLDHPVKEGDFVTLDVDVIEKEPHENLFSKTRFEVTDKTMAKWMKDLIMGHSKGETLEGTSVPDAHLSEKEKEAFPPRKVRIFIREIEEAKLPEHTENYYKALGVTGEEPLRNNITKLLNEKADSHVKEGERAQAIEFLLHQHPFDLPASFVMNETRFRMQQLLADPQFAQQWKTMGEEEQRKAIQSIMEQSEKAVRLFYLCNRILKDAKIKISPEDLPKPPTTPLEVLVNPHPDYYLQENEKLREAEAYSKLVLEKAEDYIISHATRT